MNEPPSDQRARDRFRDEWDRNFAVSANAGSGKTTAISERLAALALAPGGAELLRKTAVVTFTKKAAAQIGQRARQALLRRLGKAPASALIPLDHLERAFFGTIHSFCLLLAQRYGQTLGINLNPAVIDDEEDDALWEEFLEQDAMAFTSLPPAQIDAFLRHAPLDAIFQLARDLDVRGAAHFSGRTVAAQPPGPAPAALQDVRDARTRAGRGAAALQRNQAALEDWNRRFQGENGYLPLPEPEGSAGGIEDLFARCVAPLKAWLADAGAVLAAELALRYRTWRFERGVQTYADQVEAALAVLADGATLERIRGEGWRVILDEAQDTDPQQFVVLVEIARPPGATLGTWPGGGAGPRPGHFCMVGDGQQAIYGSRADIRNFQRHLEAFRRGDGGELLVFDVTFRTPHQQVLLLNRTLEAAFGATREHNLGVPPSAGAPPPLLQVPYGALVAGPRNEQGAAGVLLFEPAGDGAGGVDARLAAEVRQLAAFLKAGGPGAVGARTWGEICILAPRNAWLLAARKEFEAAGLATALQMRKNRNGDNPAYAWTCGLLAALCDPENPFEWVGVLREVFGISDALIAATWRREKSLQRDDLERYPEPLRSALGTLRPFLIRIDAEGEPLERFAGDLMRACALAERARRIEPIGTLNAELERLLAHAAEMGLTGAGPRAWRRELLATRDQGRPAGKPTSEAINLLTAHSAKGLEWPVVIPIGLWRQIYKRKETGLRLVPDATGHPQIFFDSGSLPQETLSAREREWTRELVRLLYVTLTRSRRALVLPWGAGLAPDKRSLAELWGVDLGAVDPFPSGIPVAAIEPAPAPAAPAPRSVAAAATTGVPPALVPDVTRLLPHQLAHRPDAARTVLHEASLDQPPPGPAGEDPIDYGTWWHETMEFMPWEGDESAVTAHGVSSLAAAERQGFRARAEVEWIRLLASTVWPELRQARWTRMAELGVFAPLQPGAWIDGVIDLVMHDPVSAQLWVVDWKTNRRREGESDEALLERLGAEYEPQLQAYGTSLSQFFPGAAPRLLVYSTVAGAWREAK
jgi:ATP-dependent exoDNAse (exonuclease V) beta subunit